MPYLGNRPDNIVIRNAQQEFNYTATSSQTTFTGLDTNNNTLAYNPGNVEVFFNGARLEEADFTATNGTSIVLASAAATNDLISIVSTDVFEVTDTVSRQNGGTFIGDVTMSGNLTVNGTTTSVNSNEVNIGDNILKLNSDETGTPSQNAGIEVERGSATNVAFRWNETTDKWQFTNDGSSYIDLGESDLVGDTTPQLGGNLDLNSSNITGTGNINITGTLTASDIEIDNLKLDGNTISSTDSNGNINLSPNGTGKVYITNDSYASTVIVESTIDGTQTAPDIELYKNSASPATNDYLGNILFYGNNSSNQKHIFAQIATQTYGVTAGAENGSIQFWSLVNGTSYNRLWFAHGGLVINESGIDSYTRIEGLNDINLVYVDAANDRVGIGTSTPDEKLQVIGSVDIGPTTIPWTRTSASGYNSLSLSGDTASSSGFLYLGNGASATNADFDLYRILGFNGATQVSQISTVTNTGANDDGRIEFYTKSTGASMSSAMTLEADGRITAEKSIITNPNTISTNTTLPSSSNSMAIGPITLNATLTIPNGSTWTIV